jgi:septal ring factor EnvC (AmiA/AmiB activator)
MLNSIAVVLLKMLLAYLGSNIDAETRAAQAEYEAKRLAAEEKQKQEAAAIAEIENEIIELRQKREQAKNGRTSIEAEIERTRFEIEEKNREKQREMDRLSNLSPDDVLHFDFGAIDDPKTND